jgi:hypothetical protein
MRRKKAPRKHSRSRTASSRGAKMRVDFSLHRKVVQDGMANKGRMRPMEEMMFASPYLILAGNHLVSRHQITSPSIHEVISL